MVRYLISAVFFFIFSNAWAALASIDSDLGQAYAEQAATYRKIKAALGENLPLEEPSKVLSSSRDYQIQLIKPDRRPTMVARQRLQ